jgi:hypothetical protein
MFSIIICVLMPFYLTAVWFANRFFLRRVLTAKWSYVLGAILAAVLPVLVIVLVSAINVIPQFDGYCYVWTDISYPCSLPMAVLLMMGIATLWSLPLLFISVPVVTLIFALGSKGWHAASS